MSLTAQIDEADLARLETTFNRYSARYGQNVKTAVERTMVKVVVAFRGSTVQSKKQRRIVKNPYRGKRGGDKAERIHGYIQQWYDEHSSARHTQFQGRMLNTGLPKLKTVSDAGRSAAMHAIEVYRQRGKRYVPILSGTDSRRKKDSKAFAAERMPKIYFLDERGCRRRGIAKSSWGWILKQLGKPSGATTQNASDIRPAVNTNRGTVAGAGGGWYTFIEFVNALSYIRKATKASVTDVLGKAERMMASEIERDARQAALETGCG